MIRPEKITTKDCKIFITEFLKVSNISPINESDYDSDEYNDFPSREDCRD